MALRMPRPWKHPKTSTYYLRRRVPQDLRGQVGSELVKLSLGTKDPEAAKRLFIKANEELEARWAALRKEQTSLTEVEAHALAIKAYDYWLACHRDNPSEQYVWFTEFYGRLWTHVPELPDPDEADKGEQRTVAVDDIVITNMRRLCLKQADYAAEAHGLTIDDYSHLRLAKAIGAALQRASLVLEREAQGIYVDPRQSVSGNAAVSVPSPHAPTASTPLTFDVLLASWKHEKQPRERTVYEWNNVLREFEVFVGHNDARRVTPADVVRWKEALIAKGLKAKTIKDGKLVVVRTLFSVAVGNQRLASNPAAGITIDIKRRAGESRRGFTDREAALILDAAARSPDSLRRWVPWLCAYSGARLSEVCQLRAEDIVEVDGVWAMRFDPEAGSLKSASAERTVPLHSALLTVGFLDFVRGVGAGPLFPDLPPDKFGRRGGNGTKILGPWVRKLGITDDRIQPNHAWRHRFKTLARHHALGTDMVDAIVGHARRTVADS